MKRHQLLGGKPKYVTIFREGKNWYVSVCVEFTSIPLPKTGSMIGIDVGTVRLATTSNGKYKKRFESPEIERQIKTKQREVARRKKCSKNWWKSVQTLEKLHKKLRNKRKDYLHKYSRKLVNSHDIICVEDLKIPNMTRSAKGTVEKPGKNVRAKSGLNRVINMQGWGIFFKMLEYKCLWAGRKFIKVDPRYTSQICNNCGYQDKKNRKSQSKFECGYCGFKINADQNASRNILLRGLMYEYV